MKKSKLFLLGLLLLVMASFSQAKNDQKDPIPPVSFRDLVIFNHFDLADANTRTIGTEVEMVGLAPEEVVKILTRELGGTYAGTAIYENEEAHFIKDTAIGDIRIEPVNFGRLLKRWRQTHPDSNPSEFTTKAVAGVDSVFGQLEIVTAPISYSQTKQFAKAIDALGIAGAKGASNLGRFISVQPNIGIDYANADLIKNILSNYYRNKAQIRKDIGPIFMRYQFLGSVTDDFMTKLNDPSWHPNVSELFDAYQEGSKAKLTRVQLFNALISNAENFSRFEQPKVGKQRPQRPVAEMREANTVMSTEDDPTRASRNIMREVDFALSIVQASQQTGSVDADMEARLFAYNIKAGRKPGCPVEDIPSLRSILRDENHIPLVVRPVSDKEVIFMNPTLAANFGVAGSTDEMKEQIASRYAVEVDHSVSKVGTRSEDPTAPYATAHNDGAGGVGDGRALIFSDSNGYALSLKGSGLTPYQIHDYASWLGLHTGGTDGKMSYKEGIRTWAKGEILHSLGIESERAISIIDDKGVSTKDKETEPSAQLLRQLPGGGIRNSHINHWDANQTREGLEYLKGVASAQTGRKFTDTTFVAFDAVKTGELAAKMQDFLMIHGALAKGNVLAYPGLVDISGISFLSSPDPEFASFAYLSRFGNQANTLKRLLHDRKMAYAKTNKGLLKVDEQALFDESYKKELSILAIMRLGFNRENAEMIFERNSHRALKYGEMIWKYQFGRLHTDMDVFQSLIPKTFREIKNLEVNLDQATTKIVDQSDGSKRPLPESRRNFIAVVKNRFAGNYSALNEKEAKEVLKVGLKLVQEGLTIPGVKIDSLVTSASKREALLENLDDEIGKRIKAATAAKKEGRDTAPALEEISRFLTKFDTKMRRSSGTFSRAVISCSDLFLGK